MVFTTSDCKTIVAKLTAQRLADAEHIQSLEVQLHAARVQAEQAEQDARHYRAQAASLDTTERVCRALQKELETTTGALEQVASSGSTLADEVSSLMRGLEARTVPQLANYDSAHAGGHGSRCEGGESATTTEAQAILKSNYAAAISSYTAAAQRIETLVAAVHALDAPLGNFRAAIVSAKTRPETAAVDIKLPQVFASAEEEARHYVQMARDEVHARFQVEENARFQRGREANRRAGEEARRRKAELREAGKRAEGECLRDAVKPPKTCGRLSYVMRYGPGCA